MQPRCVADTGVHTPSPVWPWPKSMAITMYHPNSTLITPKVAFTNDSMIIHSECTCEQVSNLPTCMVLLRVICAIF